MYRALCVEEWGASLPAGHRASDAPRLAFPNVRIIKAFQQAGERLGLYSRELAVIKGALAEIPAVKKAPPEVSVISPEERAKLLEALRVPLVAETLYVTGARVSESLGDRRD